MSNGVAKQRSFGPQILASITGSPNALADPVKSRSNAAQRDWPQESSMLKVLARSAGVFARTSVRMRDDHLTRRETPLTRTDGLPTVHV